MAGINFLYEEYKKDPRRIEKLLTGKIEVSEKLDGSRFQVESDSAGDLKYFKRKDVPITSIDRTLAKYYEKAISHFETLGEEKISQLPEGWRFGMEYFPNLQPVTITYDNLPLNNLVLTDIQVRDPKGKILEIINDQSTLNDWSEILEVEKPPIYFEGSLSESQITRILDFLNTPFEDLTQRFKTESFTKFLLNIINPEMKKAFLHNDSEKDIYGLIFRFDGKEAFRVSDPNYIEKKKIVSKSKPSDIYNLTLVFLQEFLTSLDFKRIKLKEKTFEKRYIEFISKAFNLFVQTPIYREHFEKGVDFELPKFLTREESSLNFKFVQDEETKELLKKSNANQELFKILLASMRSHKRKPSGFFTKELLYHHNQLVDKIADYINSNLLEASFYTFGEFKSVFLNESEWQEEFGKESEEEEVEFVNVPTYLDVSKAKKFTNVEAPINVLKNLVKDVEEPKKKMTKVCLIKGKFQPFHNGHKSIIEDAAKSSKMKVFLVVQNPRVNSDVMTEELHREMLEKACENDQIAGYTFSNGRTISEISRDLPEKIEICGFAGSVEECQDVKIEMGVEFPVHPMTRHIRSGSILKKIQDEDYKGYKKLVPKEFHNYFYKIKNEMKLHEEPGSVQ